LTNSNKSIYLYPLLVLGGLKEGGGFSLMGLTVKSPI